MKYRFIEDNRHRYGVQLLCEVLQVSRSGFYAARCRPPSVRRQRQAALTSRIREIHASSRQTYGAPRVHAELHAQGVPCCRNTVARLMRQAQIVPRSVRRFRVHRLAQYASVGRSGAAAVRGAAARRVLA